MSKTTESDNGQQHLSGIPKKCQCGTWARYKTKGIKLGQCFIAECPACHRSLEIIVGAIIELRFTGEKRRKEKRPCRRGNYHEWRALVWAYETNHGWLTVDDMAAITGIKRHTINTRLTRYGQVEDMVFSKTPLPRGGGQQKRSGRPERNPEEFKVGTWEAKYL